MEEIFIDKFLGNIGPALFFYVNGKLLFHGCNLEEAEQYGLFLNFPHSHYDVWINKYEQKYGVEFDYYPRGRVVYRSSDDTYLIYYDKCMEPYIDLVTKKYVGKKIKTNYDEHYQCHKCNENYNFPFYPPLLLQLQRQEE